MVDRRAHKVRRRFGRIAPRYDLLNRMLSLSVDQHWRRRAHRRIAPLLPASPMVLDLCTGTGDLALQFSERGTVIGCDFCHEMLVIGLRKSRSRQLNGRVRFVEGDALQLPFRAGFFDVVTIAFGFRNLEDYPAGLEEMHRVLGNSGILAILEFSEPRLPVFRQAYRLYFTRVLPVIGRLVSGEEGPYSYLPESVLEFPDPGRLEGLILDAGFQEVRHFPMTAGIATLHVAVK